jgi:hypothetical protein
VRLEEIEQAVQRRVLLMSDRADLPKNKEADEIRKAAREVMIEYLRKMTSEDERKAILKAAFNEWFDTKFGGVFFSLQAIIATVFFYLVYLWFTGPSK